jgi:hypothetical protein
VRANKRGVTKLGFGGEKLLLFELSRDTNQANFDSNSDYLTIKLN